MKLAIIGAAAVVAAEAKCATAIDNCTGNKKIDAVLKKADLGCKFGLEAENKKYTYKSFCDTLKAYNKANLTNDFELGGKGGCKKGLANIGAFITQTKWESGHFKQCDEINWSGAENPSCTQKSTGELYASLNDESYACTVDDEMSIQTTDPFRDSVLECTPGKDSATKGCCQWGRGPIQTTGPNNYGDLQENVIKKIAKKDKSYKGIDLCKNPQQLCKDDKVKWIGAIHYWANNVQTATISRIHSKVLRKNST